MAPSRRAAGWRWWAAVAVALLAPLIVAVISFRAPVLSPESAPLFFHEALLAVPDGAAETPAWQPVALPYSCPTAEAPGGCAATLRLTYRHDPGRALQPGDMIAFYSLSFQGALSVSVNGTFLGTSLWRQAEDDLAAMLPLMITVPAPLLREGDNDFELRLEVSPATTSRSVPRHFTSVDS